MDKGSKRIVIDIIDAEGGIREALALGLQAEIQTMNGPAGTPVISLYGPKEQVVSLLKLWGYDEKGCAV